MEHGARLSTSRVLAIGFICMGVFVLLSLVSNIIQGVNNYRLQNEQKVAVTPMLFNAPFAVSQNQSDASYMQQLALSFIALRLNVTPETVDASHAVLLAFIKPAAQNELKVKLAEEAIGIARVTARRSLASLCPNQLRAGGNNDVGQRAVSICGDILR